MTSTQTPTLYGIPNCDTVKKARAWLSSEGIGYTFHDFKKEGVPPDRLDVWISRVGWEKLLNRKGNAWRALEPSVQAGVSDEVTAKAVMLQTPSSIKRPVVDWGQDQITVGFGAALWKARTSANG